MKMKLSEVQEVAVSTRPFITVSGFKCLITTFSIGENSGFLEFEIVFHQFDGFFEGHISSKTHIKNDVELIMFSEV